MLKSHVGLGITLLDSINHRPFLSSQKVGLDNTVLQEGVLKEVPCEKRPEGNEGGESKISGRAFLLQGLGSAKALRPGHAWCVQRLRWQERRLPPIA